MNIVSGSTFNLKVPLVDFNQSVPVAWPVINIPTYERNQQNVQNIYDALDLRIPRRNSWNKERHLFFTSTLGRTIVFVCMYYIYIYHTIDDDIINCT